MTRTRSASPRRGLRAMVVAVVSALALSGCGFSPYELPLPGGANLGDDPYEVTVEFRDVLDLVPQSAVRVDDIAVGKVTKIELNGWTATTTLRINSDATLPADAEAKIRQSSLLGEKFVELAAPAGGGRGELSDGDAIGLDRSGRNPDIEEVLGAASLLLNGGGLEKTNTIVVELSNALEGNEPEVKELLQTTESFIGQLDDNKEDILVALEKVNNLAIETNRQEGAITSALDELPEALEVLDEQRAGLVGLLEALDELGVVATDVIDRTKDDTLAVLRDLEPTLKGLADAGDDLAKSTEVLLSFPFSDAIVGNDLARAMEPCPENATSADERIVQDTACYGDYANLDINLDLNATQAISLIEGVISLGTAALDDLPIGGAAATEGETPEDGETAAEPSPADSLVELVEGLVPRGEDAPATPQRSGGGGSGGSGGGAEDGGGRSGGFCSLLGSCRTTPTELMDSQDDFGRLLIGPAVAR